MQNTTNLKLKKPENTDPVEIQDFNDNADILDQAIAEKVDKAGDGSNLTNKFVQAASRVNLVSGEKQSVSFGKIVKYFADLKAAAFSGNAADLTPDATHRFTTDTEKAAWNAKVTASGGDIADTKVSAFTASTAAYPVPVAGETPRVFMGKVKKFFEDMNNLRASMLFIGSIVNNCVTNNASLPLSAAQGKALMDLYTQLNSDLADKQSKTSDNLIHGTSKYVKANGVSAEAWKTSPVTFLAPTTENSSSRAQVAFENNGFNACIIWLDINGDLRLSDNSGRRYKFNLTEII